MNFEAREKIQKELDPGEKLIWAGIPKQGILFRGNDIFIIPFSLLWGGFAIFWEIGVLTTTKGKPDPIGVVFPIFGIPFVLMGIYMIFGRFIHDSKKRANTYYGLTDQRAIIVSGIISKTVKSINLKTISDVSLSEKSNLIGTITFGQENQMMSLFTNNSFPGLNESTVPKFDLIDNAKDVYNQLRTLQKS